MSKACSKAVSISLSSLNRISPNCFLFRKQEEVARTSIWRRCATFSYCSRWFSSKNSSAIQARCAFALSSWKMRPRRPRVYLRSDTGEKTCHKHGFTYQLELTIAPVSNETSLIKADLMKETATILFPGTFLSMNFAWTLISCRQANFSLSF